MRGFICAKKDETIDRAGPCDRQLETFMIKAARKYPHAFRLSDETQGRLDAWRARKAAQASAQRVGNL